MRRLSRGRTKIDEKIGIILFLLFLSIPVQSADSSSGVVINEIAWMGNQASYNDEWIELYNNTNSPIDIADWALKTIDETPKISLKGVISANGFYLLERTDDNSAPNITADQIYTGALGNNGERLELYDSSDNLIDTIDCSAGWFAGDNLTKQTMERKNPQSPGNEPNNWDNSQSPEGTPRNENSAAKLDSQSSSALLPETSPAESDRTKIEKTEPKFMSYPSKIIISEILPSPAGPDAENEWIELQNQNGFEVNLSNWKIEDVAGGTHVYNFPEGTTISIQGFLVIWRPQTKITLNNSGDSLNIIQPDGNAIDKVSYGKAPQGQSYNQTELGWAWSNALTPGSPNIISKKATENSSLPTKLSSEEIGPPLSGKDQKGMAAVGSFTQVFQKGNLSLGQVFEDYFTLLTALTLAVSSGIIILVLKKKLKTS